MPAETELERMIVRVIGDVDSYLNNMRKAAETTSTTSAAVTQSVNKLREEVKASYVAMGKTAEDATMAMSKAMERGSRITEQVMTSQEKYSRETRELSSLLAIGAINQDTYNRALATAKKNLDDASRSADKFAAAATIAGAAITGSFGKVLKTAVLAAGEFEQSQISFETLLGSAQEATKTLERLNKFAAETPFQFPEIEKAARGLIAFGDKGDELMATLTLLGNAAAGTGTQFTDLSVIFNQIRGTGVLLTQDFRQLSTRGVLLLQDIAKHFGVTDDAAMAMISDSKVGFADVRDILRELSAEGGRFHDMMERQSKSTLGLFSTLQDNARMLSKEIGEQLDPVTKSLTNNLASLVQMFRDMPEWLKTVAAAILVLVAAMGAMLVIAGASILLYRHLVLAALEYVTAARAVAVATVGLKLALIGLAVAGVAELVRGFVNSEKEMLQFQQAVDDSKKSYEEFLNILRQREADVLTKASSITDKGERRMFLEKEITQAKTKVAQYRDEVKNLSEQFDELNGRWKRWTSNPLLEGITQSLKQSKSALEQWQNTLAKLENQSRAVRAPEKDPEVIKAVDALTKKFREEADTIGMTAQEIEVYKVKVLGATDAMLKANIQQSAFIMNMKKTGDTLQEVQKFAEQLMDDVRTAGMDPEVAKLDTLKMKVRDLKADMGGFLSKLEGDELKKFEEQLDKLNATVGKAEVLVGMKQRSDEFRKMTERGIQLTKQLLTPMEQFHETSAELRKLFDQGVISQSTFTRGMDEAKKKLMEVEAAALKTAQSLQRFDAAFTGSAEALMRINQFKESLGGRLQIGGPFPNVAPMPREMMDRASGPIVFPPLPRIGTVPSVVDANTGKMVTLLDKLVKFAEMEAKKQGVVLGVANVEGG